jgi:hypothetical protein
MKWYRILCGVAVFALISCSNPAGPKYPDTEEDQDASKTDDPDKTGLLPAPPVNVTFWV